MAKGEQFFPGAIARRYDTRYPGAQMEINCCVTHTTEGTNLPDYGGGSSAPNTTLVPDLAKKRLIAYGHFPADMSARALVDREGGPTTNRNNCHQVELVGTCDPVTHAKWTTAGREHIYWPEPPEWALAEYGRYVAWLHTEHGIPLTMTDRPWLPYPRSYGSASGQRMTDTEWSAFTGHCGHQHVPQGNDHGDPGSMPFAKVLAYAKAAIEPTTPPPAATQPPPTAKPPAFPGSDKFGPGANNAHVTALGAQLVKLGFGKYYSTGPGPRWSEADRKAVAAFQRSRKQLRGDADGLPGPKTWRLLFS